MANLVAAGPHVSGDLFIGLLIGAAAGFLIRPAVRSWLASKEWAEASRRAHLTDEVLAHMDDELRHQPDEAEAGEPHPVEPQDVRGNRLSMTFHRWQPRP
jgi:hypothetical protein